MPVTLASCLGLASRESITSRTTLFLLSNVRSWNSEMLRSPHASMTASLISIVPQVPVPMTNAARTIDTRMGNGGSESECQSNVRASRLSIRLNYEIKRIMKRKAIFGVLMWCAMMVQTQYKDVKETKEKQLKLLLLIWTNNL